MVIVSTLKWKLVGRLFHSQKEPTREKKVSQTIEVHRWGRVRASWGRKWVERREEENTSSLGGLILENISVNVSCYLEINSVLFRFIGSTIELKFFNPITYLQNSEKFTPEILKGKKHISTTSISTFLNYLFFFFVSLNRSSNLVREIKKKGWASKVSLCSRTILVIVVRRVLVCTFIKVLVFGRLVPYTISLFLESRVNLDEKMRRRWRRN